MKYKIQNIKRGGFSLFEVMVAIAVAAAILFVVSSLKGNVSNLQNIINQKLQSRQDLDQTFQIMMTDIRSAGPSSLGAYPVNSASTSSFVFYSDIDQDGVFERVRYSFVTSTIVKGVIEPVGSPLTYATSSEVVSTAVENVIMTATSSYDVFQYFDSAYNGSGTPMTSPISISAIRLVKVSVYADVAAGKAPRPIFFTNMVTIRNLRDN